ncbi:MAG: sensor histidine kinase [Acutalibacteraceae bacterium]|nr:sensor histidine kinase [Acutalibacteraceae bacterium]
MQELSLNILDIAENSVKAGADRIVIDIEENGSSMKICIADNGKGMDEPTVQRLTDPFYTTRTTRKVGMGVPLFQMAAEQTGGSLRVESIQAPAPEHGTRVTAEFHTDHIDCMPLGDIVSTILTLIQGSPEINFIFHHGKDGKSVDLDMGEVRQQLGPDVPVNEPDILVWIREYLEEQYHDLKED